MSLSDAVFAIADELEGAAKYSIGATVSGEMVNLILLNFAKQLRIAVKASDSIKETSTNPSWESPNSQHARMIATFRKEFRREKEASEQGDRGVFCVDGPHDGVVVTVDSGMPEGAFTKVGESVYQLVSGKLVWKNPE